MRTADVSPRSSPWRDELVVIAPAGISPRRRNPEEASLRIKRFRLVSEQRKTEERDSRWGYEATLVTGAYIKESTYSWIYSQYARKNLDLLEQGPRGIGR